MFSIWSRDDKDKTSAQAERSNYVKFGTLDWLTISILCPCLATIQQKDLAESKAKKGTHNVLSAYGSVCVSAERLERGGPCWLLKPNGDSKRTNERAPFLVGS